MLISGRMLSVALVVLGFGVVPARADQKIVFMRHGEKPTGGYGQLTCQGLNRALALPPVLAAKYGKPNYLYAPNPAVKLTDSAGSFYYIRPLATIEPTAIRLVMNVNTRYGYNDIASLQAALITPTKANTTIFVAWEHLMLQKVVQNIMNSYGGGNFVAYDPATGRPLWHAGLGANTSNGPETFLLDGRQFVVVGAADALYAFALQP